MSIMKTTRSILLIVLTVVVGTVTGCDMTSYDNYDEPESELTGAVVHEGDTIRVRSNAVELELWEDGYRDYEKIPVYVDQDGKFSAKLFDGRYKMTELLGSGPWVPSSDTVEFDLNGDHNMAFQVEPYYKITSEDISLQGSSIVADFTLEEVNGSQEISFVTLFLGKGKFTSIRNNNFFWNQYQEGITINDDGANTMDVTLSQIPEELSSRDYVYARICVEIVGKEDALYSKVYKIQLQ